MEKYEGPNNIEDKEEELHESDFYPIENTPLIQKRYDRIASIWNTDKYDWARIDHLIPTLINSAEIEDGQKILEPMCGTAILAKAIKDKYPKAIVYGLDLSQGMLNEAPREIHKVAASVIGMPFCDDCFDRILLRTAVHDLPLRLQLNALKEIKRILKEDGIFILQTYFTSSETSETINSIINLRDQIAGQYQPMGKKIFPRHFSTIQELEDNYKSAGFNFERVEESVTNIIRIQSAKEMPEMGEAMGVNYVQEISPELKKIINLRQEEGAFIFDFPLTIYKLTA